MMEGTVGLKNHTLHFRGTDEGRVVYTVRNVRTGKTATVDAPAPEFAILLGVVLMSYTRRWGVPTGNLGQLKALVIPLDSPEFQWGE